MTSVISGAFLCFVFNNFSSGAVTLPVFVFGFDFSVVAESESLSGVPYCSTIFSLFFIQL